jgi:hypothetical protein
MNPPTSARTLLTPSCAAVAADLAPVACGGFVRRSPKMLVALWPSAARELRSWVARSGRKSRKRAERWAGEGLLVVVLVMVLGVALGVALVVVVLWRIVPL